MSFQKQPLQTCPNCGEDRLRTIESRKTKDSTRRRKCCEYCKQRITTHEVTAEFFEEAKQNAMLLQQLYRLLNITPSEMQIEQPKCDDCNYNKGDRCEYGFPEYNTSESFDCTWYAS
jgi:hypothetical protein